jgi:uncharacterized cupredoxin-like copper-binding protein
MNFCRTTKTPTPTLPRLRGRGRRHAEVGVLAAMLAAALPAWPATAPPQTVTVLLNEYAFDPSALLFQHGVEYRLQLKNVGKEIHEFTAPQFLKAIRIESPGIVNRAGNQIDVAPGAEKDLVFRAPRPGHYRLWCADHDWAGMTGSITVK